MLSTQVRSINLFEGERNIHGGTKYCLGRFIVLYNATIVNRFVSYFRKKLNEDIYVVKHIAYYDGPNYLHLNHIKELLYTTYACDVYNPGVN